MNHIRSMTGVCPQHNILFDTLSCWEHLDVYCNLKGVPRNRIKQEVCVFYNNVLDVHCLVINRSGEINMINLYIITLH